MPLLFLVDYSTVSLYNNSVENTKEDFIMSVYVRNVAELIEYLKTLPDDTIVCDSDSGTDGLICEHVEEFNFVMFKGSWDHE